MYIQPLLEGNHFHIYNRGVDGVMNFFGGMDPFKNSFEKYCRPDSVPPEPVRGIVQDILVGK